MQSINIATDFSPRLVNRDQHQGDGRFNAIEFRERYLAFLDAKDKWGNDRQEVILDFTGVEKLGPSFANEAFAYFTQYASPDLILKKIKCQNISVVKLETIAIELRDGYSKI